MHLLQSAFINWTKFNLKHFSSLLLGSGYSSSLGSPGGVGGERVAVIAGSIGGVILVSLLIAGYCYCFPAGFVRRRKRKADSRPLDEELKNGNGAMPMVNGGSLVVTSASRGSVLLNIGQEGGNGGANESFNMRNQNLGNESDNNDNMNNGEPQEKNDEFPQALEPRLRSIENDDEEEGSKTLSMSIPDSIFNVLFIPCVAS